MEFPSTYTYTPMICVTCLLQSICEADFHIWGERIKYRDCPTVRCTAVIRPQNLRIAAHAHIILALPVLRNPTFLQSMYKQVKVSTVR